MDKKEVKKAVEKKAVKKKEVVSDVVVQGASVNNWRLLSKSTNKKEGWQRTTRGLQLNSNDVLVQVTDVSKTGSAVALTTVKGNLHESTEEKGIYIIG